MENQRSDSLICCTGFYGRLVIDKNSFNMMLSTIFGDIDRHNKDEFLVDLHKLSGTVMEFLEFASNFVSSIQQEGLIVTK